MYILTEQTIFNEKSVQVEIHFTESFDPAGNYDIIRITGGEGMAVQNWIHTNVTPVYARKQLNDRMSQHIYKIKNPKYPYNKK